MARKKPVQYERLEMETLAAYLDRKGLLWCHVPNEGRHHVAWRKVMRRTGVKPGVPDVLIFHSPERGRFAGVNGVAIELKANRRGARVSPEQRAWLHALEKEGWLALVAYGAEGAIRQLEMLY